MPFYVIYNSAWDIVRYGQSSKLSWNAKAKAGEEILEVPALENGMDVKYKVEKKDDKIKVKKKT